jgi:hypothetical protein
MASLDPASYCRYWFFMQLLSTPEVAEIGSWMILLIIYDALILHEIYQLLCVPLYCSPQTTPQ